RCTRDSADDAGGPVQTGACKDAGCPEQRMLLTSRKLIQHKLLDIECDMRGTLRNFGLKVGIISTAGYDARIRYLVESFPQLAAIVEPLLTVRRVMRQLQLRPSNNSRSIGRSYVCPDAT